MDKKTFLESKLEHFEGSPDLLAQQLLIDLMEQVVGFMDTQGLRNKDLAEKLGVSRSYVTRLLEGQPNLTVKSLAGLATALGCSVNISLRPDISQLDVQSRLIERHSFETRNTSGHWTPDSEDQAA